MGGALGQKVNQIASDFNASQSEYVIKPVYKGTYPETMTSAVAAFRAKTNLRLFKCLRWEQQV